MTEMESMQREIEHLKEQRSKMGAAHMQRYRDGTATRAKTTSYNAESSRIGERIEWLKVAIRSAQK